jgi:fumarate reductase flavoprotein subunit
LSEGIFDVVVVGGGGAGLMSALAAARHGRSVLLLEKGPRLGGTTALSVGTICATSTRLQREAGIDDSPDAHFADLDKFVGPLLDRDNLKLRRVLVDQVPETIALLEELGITFMGPLPEPPHSKPRLHAIIPHSRGFIRHLEKACLSSGVTIHTGRPVRDLIYEGGLVRGVRIADPSPGKAPEAIRSRLGVILASGDFSAAPLDYKRRYMSGSLLEIGGINPGSTGDGQAMGEAVGAEVVNGDLAWGPEIRFTAPPRPSLIARLPTSRWFARLVLAAKRRLPDAWLRPFLLRFVTTYLAPSHGLFRNGAILVNAQGERFCDECERPQDAIGRQPGQSAFIICDQAIANRFEAWPNFVSTAPGVGYAYLSDYARSRPDLYATASTLEALAARIGVPHEALAASVAAHNAALGEGTRLPIAQGPFHALGPAKSWIVFSEGGLRIDTEFRVLDRAGQIIRGLFAAGSAGQGGVLLEGHGHHLAWAFTSGRLAGRNAALATPPD